MTTATAASTIKVLQLNICHSGIASCYTRDARFAATAPVVVAGDWNLRHAGHPNVQECVPAGFYRKGDGDVQHVFASGNLGFVDGTRISMSGTTDHPAWLVTLALP